MTKQLSTFPVDDLVVVIPGIQGTVLVKDGKPVWGFSGRAIFRAATTLGGSITALKLPADIGDDHPSDGVEPAGLMPDLHGLPGVGPFIGGYSDLSMWLRATMGLEPATPAKPGNLLEFGYDWRLSNRYSAARLKEAAERELGRWRADGHPNARLILYCHSMGGLVARYYLEVGGGAEHTSALVTVGTPHRGSLKALENLANGLRYGVGRLALDVGTLARSFPSTYQLLPTYSCINLPDAKRASLREFRPARLDAQMVADAFRFHDEIDAAAKRNGDDAYRFRMVVGTRQPTTATANIVGDGTVVASDTIDGNDERGDGTVPRFASIPLSVRPDDVRQLSSAQRHGWLQQNQGVLDDLHGILTAHEVVYLADPPDLQRQPGIQLPEVLAPGEPLTVTASSGDEHLLLQATLADSDGAVCGDGAVVMKNLGGGKYETTLDPPADGLYTVTVGGVRGPGIEAVTEAVLVAPTESE